MLRNYWLNHAPQQRTVVAGAPAPSQDAAHQAPIGTIPAMVTRRGARTRDRKDWQNDWWMIQDRIKDSELST